MREQIHGRSPRPFQRRFLAILLNIKNRTSTWRIRRIDPRGHIKQARATLAHLRNQGGIPVLRASRALLNGRFNRNGLAFTASLNAP